MKDQVKTPVIVVAVVALVGVLYFVGAKAMTSGDLDHGQVRYTPGKPPWLETDPSKRGPGGGAPTPSASGPPGEMAPIINNAPTH